MLPSANELTYFHEVALSGSFSKAASRLNISQSSLSMAIKRLEKTLDIKLFYRNSHGVTLTRAGKELLPHIEDLLIRWDNIKLQVTATHHKVKGTVTIGCHLMMSPYIGPLIAYLLKMHPGIEVNLRTETSEKITALVMDLSVDIGIVVNPVEHPSLVISNIIETDFTFWTGAGNLPVQQFNSGEAIVICDPEIPQVTTLLKQLDTHRLSYSRISKVNGMENVANLAFHGCGIAILPACFVAGVFGGKL